MNEKEAILAFMGNDFWRWFYENAPSKVCKQYILYNFCKSAILEKEEEYSKKARELEQFMGVDDFKHLMITARHTPLAKRYADKITEINNREEEKYE